MSSLNMKPHVNGGTLITFCGLDGCGKSTMIRRLSKTIAERGGEVFLTKQPTDMMRKSDIFRTYMDCEDHSAYEYRALSLMAAADRIQHVNKVILPELISKKTVISDRYFYSCLANLRARSYGEDAWIYEISKDIIRPDIAFFLDVPVETAVSRVRSRIEEKDRYIDMDLQYRLRDEYINICNENNGILISSNKDEDESFEEILMCLENYMGGRKHE